MENDRRFSYLLHFALPNSTYYVIKGQTWQIEGMKPVALCPTFGGNY